MNNSDTLSLVFSALSDPTRRSILNRLSQKNLSVTEIATSYEISLPAITKHLKVLEKAKLISRNKEAQWRYCQFEAQPLKDANDWIAVFKSHWEESFDRLDQYLISLQNNTKGKKNGKSKK